MTFCEMVSPDDGIARAAGSCNFNITVITRNMDRLHGLTCQQRLSQLLEQGHEAPWMRPGTAWGSRRTWHGLVVCYMLLLRGLSPRMHHNRGQCL